MVGGGALVFEIEGIFVGRDELVIAADLPDLLLPPFVFCSFGLFVCLLSFLVLLTSLVLFVSYLLFAHSVVLPYDIMLLTTCT